MPPRPEALVSPAVTARLVAQTFALHHGDVRGVVAWLAWLGCTVTRVTDDEAIVLGLQGQTVGLRPGDPISCAVGLGMALFGMWWPYVVPDLLRAVGQRWRAEARGRRPETRHAPAP